MDTLVQEFVRKPYVFPVNRFITKSRFEKIKNFSKTIETPFLVVDLNVVKKRYQTLVSKMPFAKVYYAVKANPMEEVILLLKSLGSNFDVANQK